MQTLPTSSFLPRARAMLAAYGLAGLVLAAIVGSVAAWLLWGAATPPAAPRTMPVSQELEAKWGIRPDLVAVLADGGLVELRYIVLDAEKADALFEQLETVPTITAADGTVLKLESTKGHRHNVSEAGRTHFIIYRNRTNSVKPGSLTTIRIGDLQLASVPVR